jgi:hypothetical protein
VVFVWRYDAAGILHSVVVGSFVFLVKSREALWGHKPGDGGAILGIREEGENYFAPESYFEKPALADWLDEPAVDIFAGFWGTCVVTESNRVKCWGGPDGLVDVAQAAGLKGKLVAISVGGFRGCAATTTGALSCGPSEDFTEPLERIVDDLPGASEIAISDEEVCARIDPETVSCWDI